MSVRGTIVAQFKQPHGLLGRAAGWIMANRPSNRERNLWTVNLLDIQPHHRVLEIGVGPGWALELCIEKLRSGQAVGIDHSNTMTELAKRRVHRAVDEGRAELFLGGLEVLSTLQSPFDRVFSVNVVQFLPDKPQAYRDIFGVLLPGGIVATTYQPRHKNPTREEALQMAGEVKDAMGHAGFVEIRTEELSLKPVPALCVLGRRAQQ